MTDSRKDDGGIRAHERVRQAEAVGFRADDIQREIIPG
jgi:hypothetical protein